MSPSADDEDQNPSESLVTDPQILRRRPQYYAQHARGGARRHPDLNLEDDGTAAERLQDVLRPTHNQGDITISLLDSH